MIKVLKQALEALEAQGLNVDGSAQLAVRAKYELRQAIAELESQEPVAWIDRDGYLYKKPPKDLDERHPPYTPLYTHPPQRKPLTDVQRAKKRC